MILRYISTYSKMKRLQYGIGGDDKGEFDAGSGNFKRKRRLS